MKGLTHLADPRAALLGSGGVTLTVLALTESFGQLAAAVAAYAGGWWVLGLEQEAKEEDR